MSRRQKMAAVAAVTGALALTAPAAQADTTALPAAQGPVAGAWQEGMAAAQAGWAAGAAATIEGFRAGTAAGIAGWQAGAAALRDAFPQTFGGLG
jgi:hypothetical protein